MKRAILTKEGYDDLVNELNVLKTVERPQIAERIKIARGFGDLSENAEYDAAREEQKKCEGRIEEIEEILKNSDVFSGDEATDASAVNLNSKVKILDIDMNETLEFTLKGTTEANPKKQIISIESPLGKALLGGHEGDTILVDAPAGKIQYKILKVLNS